MKLAKLISIACLFLVFLCACDDDPKKGCTNIDACNYDSAAEENNGSCTFICLSDTEKARVEDFVGTALTYLNENSIDDAIVAFSAPNPMTTFRKGELYIFLLDLSAVANQQVPMLAHGSNEAIIGENQYDIVDKQGKYFVQEFLLLLENAATAWAWYYWEDPTDQIVKKKFSYIVKQGDLLIGAGTYLN